MACETTSWQKFTNFVNQLWCKA